MKCNICDAALPEPKFVEELGTFDPCDKCMEVIEDTLASYTDKPAANEGDLGGPDPVLEGLFPSSYDPFGTE